MGTELEDDPNEVVGAEASGEGGNSASEGVGTSLLQSGSDVVDKFGIAEAGLLRGVLREGAKFRAKGVDGCSGGRRGERPAY